MASTSTTKRVKRLLEGGCKPNQFYQVNSKRWKKMFEEQVVEGSNIVGDEDAFAMPEGECSVSFGQASYQRSKQGLIVPYKDSGGYNCSTVHSGRYCSFEPQLNDAFALLFFF
ncbi:hypothetical protein RchiOBHm_Chr5g0016751 [Rosa chinensis]|uniref:Uncharacterized protein n=1 Tax=Rosa chinensis TaxID=74649 RepID=A0A2P6Q697_ROSCH|nr:uncharacterized protein LOC112168203 isoform X6 [Rosa chinensis]PRQ29711.1 hypothetical protein RchiOBHm_Chr5g0016751 [Rosa chinensis]